MNHIEKSVENLPKNNIDNRLFELSNNLSSIQEERMMGLCKNATDFELNKQCSSLNFIFTEETEKQGIDFTTALKKLKNPIGLNS